MVADGGGVKFICWVGLWALVEQGRSDRCLDRAPPATSFISLTQAGPTDSRQTLVPEEGEGGITGIHKPPLSNLTNTTNDKLTSVYSRGAE